MPRFFHPRLRTINDILTIVLVAFALYIILLPFVPGFTWWVQHQAPVISKPATIALPQPNTTAVPKENTLIIPNLGLSQEIHEGPTIHTLHFGIWHLPGTSNPTLGGNTVFAGHRFTYSGSGVFYHLDKVKLGDDMTIYWNQQRFNYTVTDIQTVPPTDIAVQAPTKDSRLTIYTCTPMWTFKNRVVITAQLEKAS